MNPHDTSSRTSMRGTLLRLARFVKVRLNHEMSGWQSVSHEFFDPKNPAYKKYQEHFSTLKNTSQQSYSDFHKHYSSSSMPDSLGSFLNSLAKSAEKVADAVSDTLNTVFSDKQPITPEMQRAKIQYELQHLQVQSLAKIERKYEKQRKGFVFSASMSALGFVLSLADSDWTTLLFIFGASTIYHGIRMNDSKRIVHDLRRSLGMGGESIASSVADTDIEKSVLRHAHSNKGIVYPELLAVQSDISLVDIQRVIDQCLQRSLCILELDDMGRRYYYFASLDFSHKTTS
jgi:hypothetical protein